VSYDLLQIGVGYKYLRVFTIRWYNEVSYGYRKLGDHRHAFDFGHISFVFERYTQ
jgi:hypothetical protein